MITQGRVMKRPASLGQHCRMGNQLSEKLSFRMTSLQAPVETVFGKNLPISASIGSIFTLSSRPCGDLTSMKCRMRSAMSSNESTSRASFMRRADPNWLIRTCCPGCPLTFWKSRAGPLTLLMRSVISAISRIGSTSVLTCLSSPARSSAAIQSRRSL